MHSLPNWKSQLNVAANVMQVENEWPMACNTRVRVNSKYKVGQQNRDMHRVLMIVTYAANLILKNGTCLCF